MPKVPFCASTAEHIENFHLPYLRFFREQGFEVHVAVPGSAQFENADVVHSIPMAKSLRSPQNLVAVVKLRRVLRKNRFDLILTHTALAGAVGRLAVLLAGKQNARVIQTVHGYLFWKGCSPLRKLVYYTPERLLRGVTDCVVTMNGEDTISAAGLVKKGGMVVEVPGMGVDARRFTPATDKGKQQERQALSLPEDAFVMVYAAEFSKRKTMPSSSRPWQS
jgi:glycosyltransferase EpsD